MARLSSSTSYSMANQTAMRATLSELSGWFATVGLVQTADAGQVNWTTATVPAVSTIIGYEIWRFADSTIYFKIEYFTGTVVTNTPGIFVTVGTGSDGSGAITGQTSARTSMQQNSGQSPNSTVTAYPTYMCRTDDCFWMTWKVGGTPTTPCAASFIIEKTCDSSGAATATGFCVSTQGTTTAAIQSKQAVRTAATAQTFTASTSFCAIPGNVASSVNAAGNKQVYLHAFPVPDVVLSNFIASYVKSEAAISTTISTTLVGATAHTYIALETALGAGNSSSAAATWGTLAIWE